MSWRRKKIWLKKVITCCWVRFLSLVKKERLKRWVGEDRSIEWTLKTVWHAESVKTNHIGLVVTACFKALVTWPHVLIHVCSKINGFMSPILFSPELGKIHQPGCDRDIHRAASRSACSTIVIPPALARPALGHNIKPRILRVRTTLKIPKVLSRWERRKGREN